MTTVWVDGEKSYYANKFSGFYCKTPFLDAEAKLMFYHDKYLDFIMPSDITDSLIIKEANKTKMYQVYNEKKTLYKNDELLKKSEMEQLENYQMVIDEDNNYTFTSNNTRKITELKGSDNCFEAERNGYFYFRKDNKPKQLLRLNDDFEILASYGFEGQGVYSIKISDQFAFYGYKGTPHYLEVFDLDKFIPVSPKIQVEDPHVRVYKIDELYYIRCGYSLFVWDGENLIKHDFGNNKQVANICAKKDFMYVAFEQDPYLYAYQAGSLTLLKKQRITNDGYHPLSLFSFDTHTQCDVILNEPEKKNQLNYTMAWCDEDFISDEAFEVVMEAPIHIETQIADGELFSVQLAIDASQPLEKVIRQSLSITEDAINRHGDMGLGCVKLSESYDAEEDDYLYTELHIMTSADADTFAETGKYFSPYFNGKIHLCYQNGNFTQTRQKQFQQAINNLNNGYGIFNGYALGKIKPLILSVSFE